MLSSNSPPEKNCWYNYKSEIILQRYDTDPKMLYIFDDLWYCSILLP